MNKLSKHINQSSGYQIAKGTGWMMIFKLLDRSVGLVSTLILARLLTPADFGLVAMAMAVVALTQLMSAFGFDSALIQRQDARKEHFDTAWTFNVIFGAVIAATLVVLAVPVANFYSDQRLMAVLLVLAAGAAVGGFENVGVVAFRKELDFRSEFRFLIFKRLANFLVTVVLAFSLRSYWALVVGVVTGRLLSVWISYRIHPFRPQLSLAARTDLMHFSKWIFLSNFIGFLGGKSTDFILGRTVGAHGLGVYTIAYEIATMPSTELIAPLNRAVFPAYAQLAAEPSQLRELFLKIFGIICLIGVPICGGLFAVADAAVRVVLGEQWLDTVPLIRMFALCGLVGALQSNMYLVIVAMGRPQANTVLSAYILVITLPIIIWASLEHGVLGVAYALLFQAVTSITGITLVFKQNTHIQLGSLWKVLWRPVICSTLMVLFLHWFDNVLVTSHPSVFQWARLMAECLVGSLFYIVSMWILWLVLGSPAGAESLVINWVVKRAKGMLRKSNVV